MNDDKITIFQKPTCSKCRAALAILEDSGKAFNSVNYYETPFTVEGLRDLVVKLNLSLRDILRKDEPLAHKLESMTDDELIKVMVENPGLIQRPIVVRGDKARICRPPETIRDLF